MALTRNRPRSEPRRNQLAARGLAVMLVVAVLLWLAYARSTGSLGGDPEVSASVRNAGGSLRPGSDVKIAGVIVGRVRDIDRGDDGDVRVTMSMPEDSMAQVPDNVVARILPATVFGTTYVDLVVYGGPSGTSLEPGSSIAADTTQGTLELQQALDDIDRLVKALGPAELNSAISSAAKALDGRGAKIGRIIDTADAYLARVTPQLPLVRTDLRKLADNLDIVDQLAPDLLDATEDGLVTLDTIVARRASITALITGASSLTERGQQLLDRNTDQAVRLLDNATILLDILYDNRKAGITDAIAANIAVADRLPTAIDHGFLRSDAILQLDAPPFYTKADRPTYGGKMSQATLTAMAGGGRG